MSPEQKKARKLVDRYRKDMWHDDHAAELCAALARALRAERNAALEEAAKIASYDGMSDNPMYVPIPERIRSLKSRTPAPKPRGRRAR